MASRYRDLGISKVNSYGQGLKNQVTGQILLTPGSTTRSYTGGFESIIEDPPIGRFSGDRGRSMTLIRKKRRIIPSQPVSGGYGTPKLWRYVQDSVMSHYGSLALATPVPYQASKLIWAGTTGWAKYKPTAPQAGAAQFAGELKEGLPSLSAIHELKRLCLEAAASKYGRRRPPNRESILRRGSDEWLNYWFGWVPLMKDIVALNVAFKKRDAIAAQLYRDNGRTVRRSGLVWKNSESTSSTSKAYGLAYPWFDTQMYDGKETEHVGSVLDEAMWFSGKFRYYIPGLTGKYEIGHENLSRIVFGAVYNAHTLYNLTPWSWMLDWVSSTGSILNNLNDSLDNLTADYAYAMAHKRLTTISTIKGRLKNGGSYECSQITVSETKQRARASPFGFGTAPGSLSAKQVSILGALGISRTF